MLLERLTIIVRVCVKVLHKPHMPVVDSMLNDSDQDPVCVCTSLTAHIRAMDPMLLVMVTSVALARSSLLMLSRFSLLIM